MTAVFISIYIADTQEVMRFMLLGVCTYAGTRFGRDFFLEWEQLKYVVDFNKRKLSCLFMVCEKKKRKGFCNGNGETSAKMARTFGGLFEMLTLL